MSNLPATIRPFSDMMTYSELINRSEFDDVNDRIATAYDMRAELKAAGGKMRDTIDANGKPGKEWIIPRDAPLLPLVNAIKKRTRENVKRGKDAWASACRMHGVSFVSKSDKLYDDVLKSFKELIRSPLAVC